MKEFKVMRTRRKRTSFTTKKRRNYSFTPRRRKSYNKSGTVIAMVLCAVVMIGSVCAVCIKFLSYDWGRSVTPELAVADSCVVENDQLTTLIMKNGDVNLLSPAVSEKALESLEFTSSDESIVSVDSGGRVDAKKEGTATVSIKALGFDSSCEITVEKAEKRDKDDYITTAITANLDTVEKNKKDGTKNLYSIKVNRRTNVVTVYTYDKNGKYTVPVRSMICSCGEFTDENITPTGKYSVYFKNRWHPLFGDVYGQYVTGFSGVYLFHSVPYKDKSADTLKTDEFNKLGSNASQGCVRLMIGDAKWIFDNVDMNTSVEVVDKHEGADPLGAPKTVKIPSTPNWDPTDPAKKNPYKDAQPLIEGAADVTVKKNSDYEPKVTAKDGCGNDITDRLKVTGNVISSKVGTYLVTYEVTDDFNNTASVTVTVTVE